MKYFRVRYDKEKDSVRIETKLGSKDDYGLDLECDYVHAVEYPNDGKEYISGCLFREIMRLINYGYTLDKSV